MYLHPTFETGVGLLATLGVSRGNWEFHLRIGPSRGLFASACERAFAPPCTVARTFMSLSDQAYAWACSVLP